MGSSPLALMEESKRGAHTSPPALMASDPVTCLLFPWPPATWWLLSWPAEGTGTSGERREPRGWLLGCREVPHVNK